jgi:hypothetical protein
MHCRYIQVNDVLGTSHKPLYNDKRKLVKYNNKAGCIVFVIIIFE